MSRVSIVIPCYRQGRFLADAVDSALGQSHQDVEVVVVNDGSDDDTDAVAARYGGRIRYVAQENRGLAGARNAGAAAASGSRLLFLDADDVLQRDAIASLTEVRGAAEDRLCVTGYQDFAGRDVTSGAGPPHIPTADGLPFPRLIRQNIAPPMCWLVPRRRFEAVGGFRAGVEGWPHGSLWGHEDWDLWLRLALDGADVVVVPKCGAFYRRSAGSMSADRVRMTESRCTVFLGLFQAIEDRADFLSLFGDDLYWTGQHLLRQLLAARRRGPLAEALAANLETLRALGLRPPGSLAQRAVESVCGTRTEHLRMELYRWLRPRELARYRMDGAAVQPAR
jgi:glycosyltransferase involved in cell wall biosynthesis